MFNIVQKIQTAVRYRTTYNAGILQAKSFRVLKSHTGLGLDPYDISTMEWAMLGLLRDNSSGLRSSVLAEELGVEAPFITILFSKLKKLGYVISNVDQKDSRAKIICATEKGKKFVENTEIELRSHMQSLLEGISKKDLLSYLTVLEKIIENDMKNQSLI